MAENLFFWPDIAVEITLAGKVKLSLIYDLHFSDKEVPSELSHIFQLSGAWAH